MLDDTLEARAAARQRKANGHDPREERSASKTERAFVPPMRLDLREISLAVPPAPLFIEPDWLPAHQVTLLTSHGAGGKSTIALFIAVCLAAGLGAFGRIQSKRRRVLFYSAEDDSAVLAHRLHWTCGLLGIALADLEGWLLVEDATEADSVMYVEAIEPAMRLTRAYDRLHDAMRDEEAAICVLDNASDVYAANEINRAQVRDFIGQLKRLARLRPEGAVLLLGHVNRTSSTSTRSGDQYSGSTAWHNSVRSRWELTREELIAGSDPRDVPARVLTSAKSNYGVEGLTIRWTWNYRHHVFEPEEPMSPLEKAQAARAIDRGLVACVVAASDGGRPIRRAEGGSRNTRAELAAWPAFPKTSTQWSVARCVAELRRLVADHLLETRNERVDSKDYEVFMPTDAGRRFIE